MTSKKHTRATTERSLLKLVFLDFLYIRKDYYKPQQYPLKPPTENDTLALGSLYHFYENSFSGVLRGTFSWIFFTTFQSLINIYYHKCWLLKNARFFHIFSGYIFKIQWSLYTRANDSKILILKLFNKIYFEGRGIFEIDVTNQYGHKNVQ